MLLSALDLLADTIDLLQLADICFDELDLDILVQSLALLDNARCCRFVPADDIDSRGSCILHKCFGCVFADPACSANFKNVNLRLVFACIVDIPNSATRPGPSSCNRAFDCLTKSNATMINCMQRRMQVAFLDKLSLSVSICVRNN